VLTENGRWICMEWQMNGADNSVRVFIHRTARPELGVSTNDHGGGSPFVFPTFNSIWLGWWNFQGGTIPAQFNIWLVTSCSPRSGSAATDAGHASALLVSSAAVRARPKVGRAPQSVELDPGKESARHPLAAEPSGDATVSAVLGNAGGQSNSIPAKNPHATHSLNTRWTSAAPMVAPTAGSPRPIASSALSRGTPFIS
jgi:hypothetical protein